MRWGGAAGVRFLSVPLFWITEDPGLAMRAAAALWFIFAAMVPIAMWWAVRPRTGGWGAILAAVLTLHPFLVLHLARPNGLETSLYALLLLLFAGALERAWESREEPDPGRTLGLGMLLGAVVLARVDAGLYAVAIASSLGIRALFSRRSRAAVRTIVLLTLGATIVAGPSLAWNAIRFGSPLPISGRALQIYELTPVVQIHRDRQIRLDTPGGTITTDQLVLATNAYSHVVPELRRKQTPVFTHIVLTWTGPRSLQVVMDAPALRWNVVARETPALKILNPISAALPVATWRPRPLVRARELLARILGMGDIRLSGTMPSGHTGTMVPQRMYFIERSRAVLEGVDLGAPAHLKQNPKMGDIPLPSRGVLAVGQAAWRITDRAEYERTRAETAPAR